MRSLASRIPVRAIRLVCTRARISNITRSSVCTVLRVARLCCRIVHSGVRSYVTGVVYRRLSCITGSGIGALRVSSLIGGVSRRCVCLIRTRPGVCLVSRIDWSGRICCLVA